MVSLANDNLLTLKEAAPLFPGRPHRNTLMRWIRKGIQVDGVGVVKLRAAKCGRRLAVSRSAIAEFLEVQNPGYQSPVVSDSESHRAAEEKLAAMGV